MDINEENVSKKSTKNSLRLILSFRQANHISWLRRLKLENKKHKKIEKVDKFNIA